MPAPRAIARIGALGDQAECYRKPHHTEYEEREDADRGKVGACIQHM